MSSTPATPSMRTRIWLEQPEADNPFAARSVHCHGYDVYGQMLGQARWVDMLYLLFRGEAPSPQQAVLLESLAVALANAGPRDAAVHAAMCAGVGGSNAAAALIAALAVGAGQVSGAREVFLAMQWWHESGRDVGAWQQRLHAGQHQIASTWPPCAHAPGFEAHGTSCTTPVKQMLDQLAQSSPGSWLPWLRDQRAALEQAAGRPLAMSGVAAAALLDLGFAPEQGEMLHLLLRLPGAAAHALEQRANGHKNFPFFALELEDDPAGRAA